MCELTAGPLPAVRSSLQRLEANQAFQYDVTQPMGIGTPCAKVTSTAYSCNPYGEPILQL